MLWNKFFAILFVEKLRQVKQDAVINGQNVSALLTSIFSSLITAGGGNNKRKKKKISENGDNTNSSQAGTSKNIALACSTSRRQTLSHEDRLHL